MSHNKTFQTKAKIKSQYLASLPFNPLNARPVIANFLTFLGYRHEVIPLLQVLSHKTRAYTINANGLEGFLIATPVTLAIDHLIANDNIRYEITRFQLIDLNSLNKQLQAIKDVPSQLGLLKEKYPCIFVWILSKIGRG